MMSWWRGLELRERVLVATAAILTALVIVWQFALVPALEARGDARLAAETSALKLTRVQEAYIRQRASDPGAAVSNSTGASVNADLLKAEITRSAQQKGIAIARLQGGGDQPIGILIEQVEPQLALFWLEEVETRYGGTIIRLSIEQAGGQTVRISADIVGNGP